MENLEFDYKEIDGAIFLSKERQGKCLKRWYKDNIEMLDQTIAFFDFCKKLIIQLNLESKIKIPIIYKRGSDWIIMDYDLSAISINENHINSLILNKLSEACKKHKSKNGCLLLKMIENKSVFFFESIVTKQIIISGLQVYKI
jgi:hypothetical protein